MEVLRCPACSGNLDVNPGDEIVKCRFCGNSIRITVKGKGGNGSGRDVITFVDKATNMTLGTVDAIPGFNSTSMIVPNQSSYAFPIVISCSVFDSNSTVITFFNGEGFTDASKCPMLTGMYSHEVNRIAGVVFRNFQEAEKYVDNYAMGYAQGAKATGIRLVGEKPLPIKGGFDANSAMEGYKRYIAFELQRTGNAGMATNLDYYQKPVCRTYEMTINGVPQYFTMATIVEGFKYSIPGFGAMGGFNLGGGLMNSLSGLFGGNKNQANNQNNNAPAPGSFGDLSFNSVIEWRSNGVFMLQCKPENYEAAFNGAFTEFLSSFKTDEVLTQRIYEMQNQIQQRINSFTQQNLRMQQQNFQAWQQINRTQQQAFDSYNRAWSARQNASYESNRARSQAMFNGGSGGSGRADYSEAIRGVNTYTRADGSEVEVSVAYDHAYENKAGDVIGTNSAFGPGGDWNELNRR